MTHNQPCPDDVSTEASVCGCETETSELFQPSKVSCPWVGVVWGLLLLLTLIIPWGIYGDKPLWSWKMINPAYSGATKVMLWGDGRWERPCSSLASGFGGCR